MNHIIIFLFVANDPTGKLINLASYGAIQECKIVKKRSLNIFQKTENINVALGAAKTIGCTVHNIGLQDLLDGR